MEDYKYLFKVVLVGNAGVGKTCLVRKFTQGVFPPGQSATIGVDFLIKTVKVGDDKIKLQIWDTAGQERFRSITQSYYRSAHAIVLVYDVACQPSFDCLPEWLSEIEQYANRKVLKLLVGNKVDKDEEREVPERVGQNFANANGFEYFLETSALDATNVDALFHEVATRLTQEMKINDDRYHNFKTAGGGGGSRGDGAAGRHIGLIDRAQHQKKFQEQTKLSKKMSPATSAPPRGGARKRSAAANESPPASLPAGGRSSTSAQFASVITPTGGEGGGGGSSISGDDDYALKRQRNNAAVNKTRQKKRQEELNTQTRVQELRDENEKLERRLESMRRELELLKEMVVACASGRRNCASAAECSGDTPPHAAPSSA